VAISFVGAGSAVYSADALSVPWPGTQSAGDVGLLLLETNETDTVSVSGVTELASSPQYFIAQAHRFSVFWVEATGSDANISIPDPGNHGIAQILVFSGVDTTAPINVTVGTSPGVPSTAVTCAGVTTTVDGCGIVHIVGTGRDANSTAQFNSWANANLASITEIADVTTTVAGGGGFGAAWGIKTTAGSTGGCTVTQAVSAIYTTITVALKPAAGGASHNVTASNSQQANTASAAAIAQTHLLAASNSNQANVASAAAVTQMHLIGVANATQSNVASPGSVSQSGITFVVGSNSAQANTASTGSIAQTHLIGAANSQISIVASPASVQQIYLITAANSTTVNTATPGSVTQDSSCYVVGSNSTQANVASAGSISQTHLISVANSAQSNSTSAGSIYLPGVIVTGERIDLQSPITTNIALASRITRRVELDSHIN
jgi:hypothetical protein